jgi:hypothetical protein
MEKPQDISAGGGILGHESAPDAAPVPDRSVQVREYEKERRMDFFSISLSSLSVHFFAPLYKF